MNLSLRNACLAAIAGAILGVALTPFMACAWAYDAAGSWDDATLLERTIGPTLESWGVLDFGYKDLPYELYGKGFFLVYLLMIPVVRHLHAAHLATDRSGTFELWPWRAIHGALFVGGVGDFVAYWGVSIPSFVGNVVAALGFMPEILAILTLLLATPVYGIASWRIGVLPKWVCVLLMLSLPAAILMLSTVSDYVPTSPIAPLSLIWAAIAIWLGATTRLERLQSATTKQLAQPPPLT